jgi:hypothetical protein
MTSQKIQCPNCSHEFELGEAFKRRFEDEKQDAVSAAVKNAKKEAEEKLKRLETEFEEKREELKKQLEEQTQTEVEKRFKLKLEEKDEEMRRIQRQLDNIQKRTLQGSMELQGETLEVVIQSELQVAFPLDNISEVKKGQPGADIIQEVMNLRGQRCGKIIWEAKNTKHWDKKWLDKIKTDAERGGGNLRVIVSVSLPENITTFDLIDGVWVTSIDTAIALARVLRENLLQAHNLQKAVEGQEGKMEQVYAYLVSQTFRDRIQRMTEIWEALKVQVDKEESAMQKQWKERRKQLEAIISVTTDMYTDVSAIIGSDMPQVEGLSLNALPAGDSDNINL